MATSYLGSTGPDVKLVTAEAAYAGYKDWFILQYRRPGFTIEAGVGTNPIPITKLPTIYRQNEGILLLGTIVV
jgi:g-D-glutamyl-meso-diaminopimelate peptidase